MRISTIDKWIEELESSEKVDKTSEYHKNMAIAYARFAEMKLESSKLQKGERVLTR